MWPHDNSATRSTGADVFRCRYGTKLLFYDYDYDVPGSANSAAQYT